MLKATLQKYKFLFLALTPKYRKQIGSIIPSSRFLAKKMLSTMPINNDHSKSVLEVGAGAGAITKHLVKSINTTDILDIIEINKEFIKELKKITKQSNNITIHNVSILEYNPSYKYDYIISSLPFYNFNPTIVNNILNQYQNLLKPGGSIIYFQYILADTINRVIKNNSNNVSIVKKNFHNKFRVQKFIEYKNIFPAIVWILNNKQ